MANRWGDGPLVPSAAHHYLAALVWEWWTAPWHGWAAWLDANEQLLRIAAEWAEAGGEMMASVQRVPPEMMVGHCAICGEGFQYSRSRLRPPKTCGMWDCMVKAGEEVAT